MGAVAAFRAGPSPYRQSDAGDEYQAALARLSAETMVFACDCSRRDLARAAGDAFNEETAYSGRCRGRGLAPGGGRGLRLRVDDGGERFDDARLGPHEQVPAVQCGDLLLRDRLGQWTYQFAVVADDLRHGVDLVVRGEDLLESTGRQLLLGRLLGRAAPPVFLHHPLIRKPGGEKLSKSSGDTGIRELRAAGITPAAVLGRAAFLTGVQGSDVPVAPGELAKLFGSG
jgi:glutamyl/glutaminyl-tRNA synthetase